MKKKILIFLLVFCFLFPCVSMLCGCKNNDKKSLAPSFSLLQRGQTLNIGTSNKFTNYQTTTTKDYYLTYTKSATATLYRHSSSYYNYYNGTSNYSNTMTFPFFYDGMYYRWEITEVTDNMLMGSKTETKIVTYEYLIFGEDKNIVVRTTTQNETTYNFSVRECNIPCNMTYNLSGYFSSIEDLKEKAQYIYDGLTVQEYNKYYIEEPKTNYTYNESTYNDTYFYFN